MNGRQSPGNGSRLRPSVDDLRQWVARPFSPDGPLHSAALQNFSLPFRTISRVLAPSPNPVLIDELTAKERSVQSRASIRHATRSATAANVLRKTQPRIKAAGEGPQKEATLVLGDDIEKDSPLAKFPYAATTIPEIRGDVIATWLYQQQLLRRWNAGKNHHGEGVVLKATKSTYTCCPPSLALPMASDDNLFEMVVTLNLQCAMTIKTGAIRVILKGISPGMTSIPLQNGMEVQILKTLGDLADCKIHQNAAFIKQNRYLVVWEDTPRKLVQRAEMIEVNLLPKSSVEEEETEDEGTSGRKRRSTSSKREARRSRSASRPKVEASSSEESVLAPQRRVPLAHAVEIALALVLQLSTMGLWWRRLVIECILAETWIPLASLGFVPLQLFCTLFFFYVIVGSLFQFLGPTSNVQSNYRSYSGIPPTRLHRHQGALPHVTIQMPVYKESFASVIRPTLESLQAAVSTYELQGGSANIFVNDDGLQIIPEDEAMARRDYYSEHGIGWVARPPHDPKGRSGDGSPFVRRGKFKKASNMNFALHISNRVEDILFRVRRGRRWTQVLESAAYDRALADVLAQDEGRTLADGNIRVGDYILLVDADTRVPDDCIIEAVSEMEQSPDVAILQFKSGVIQVTDSFFEQSFTWFTDFIYTAMTFGVALGDAAPFVGHNALLRWSTLQRVVGYYDDHDSYQKFWSEQHVSEDLAMALRLQRAGYRTRLAAYQDGFEEGISLQVRDEIKRWQKYAFGCNELIMHPLRLWPVRGPLTLTFLRFLFSSLPLAQKMGVCAYLGSYYAMAGALPMAVVNYFVTGWLDGYDGSYVDAFSVFLSLVVVFAALGNVALAALRYRLGQKSPLVAVIENFQWLPVFAIFFSGLSLHLLKAMLCHFLEIPVEWGATTKTARQIKRTVAQEIWQTCRRYWGVFAMCLLLAGMMVCGRFVFPPLWRISSFSSVFPLAVLVGCHLVMPFALSPRLMAFGWYLVR